MTFLCLFRLFLLSRHQKRTAQKTSRNVQRQKPVETVSPKSQSKRSAPKVSRNDQSQKPVETVSAKSQATRSAPKANRHDQPQKPGNTISPKSQVLGAQGRIFAGGKPRICALFARASGHQISSMVSYLREHLGIRAPFQNFYTFFGRVFGRARVQISNVPLLRSVFFAT